MTLFLAKLIVQQAQNSFDEFAEPFTKAKKLPKCGLLYRLTCLVTGAF